jgi:hypothetical protein
MKQRSTYVTAWFVLHFVAVAQGASMYTCIARALLLLLLLPLLFDFMIACRDLPQLTIHCCCFCSCC